MVKNISEWMVEELYATESVCSSEKKIYSYGFYLLISWIITLLVTVGIGILTETVKEILLFHVFFMPLRKLSGGYHAGRPSTCFLLSVLLTAMAGVIIKRVDMGWIGFGISSIIYLMCLKYIPSLGKKSFSYRDRLRLKAFTIGLIVIYEIVVIVSIVAGLTMIYNACIISILFSGIQVITNEMIKICANKLLRDTTNHD